MGGSLWQKDGMVTHMLFDLCFFKHFSPVANFGDQSLDTCTFSLYTANALMQRSFYGAEKKSARQGQELLPFSKLKKRKKR